MKKKGGKKVGILSLFLANTPLWKQVFQPMQNQALIAEEEGINKNDPIFLLQYVLQNVKRKSKCFMHKVETSVDWFLTLALFPFTFNPGNKKIENDFRI